MESDRTVVILREIRDEIKQTRTELTGLIQETNTRLDQTNDRDRDPPRDGDRGRRDSRSRSA